MINGRPLRKQIDTAMFTDTNIVKQVMTTKMSQDNSGLITVVDVAFISVLIKRS